MQIIIGFLMLFAMAALFAMTCTTRVVRTKFWLRVSCYTRAKALALQYQDATEIDLRKQVGL